MIFPVILVLLQFYNCAVKHAEQKNEVWAQSGTFRTNEVLLQVQDFLHLHTSSEAAL